MRTLEEVRKEAEKLNNAIHDFLEYTGYDKYDELDCEYDMTAETVYIKDNVAAFLYNLDRLTPYIDRLQGTVSDHGHLHKNANGRYELNGREFTCGSSLEFLCTDGYHDIPYWRYSSIEAKNGEYYLTASPDTEMENLEVRVKRG